MRDLRRLTVLGAAAVNGQVQVMRYLVNQKVGFVTYIYPPVPGCLLGILRKLEIFSLHPLLTLSPLLFLSFPLVFLCFPIYR